MKKVCAKPFNKIEISGGDGYVYTCCMEYIGYNNIGNIWDENIKSIEDIWYSEKATELRKKILNCDYSMCNMDICREIDCREVDENSELFSLTPPFPEYVALAYDKECNLQCITCRDKKIKNSFFKNKFYNEKIETIILPLLKNAKIVSMNGSGEALYSKHSRTLIKKLTSEYKDLKFNINTNGLLFNEKNCKVLGLIGRFNDVFVSIHALDKKIYNKIMRGSNLDVVIDNMKWLSKLQQRNEVKTATISCVISDINYTEIPKLIDFAKSLNLYISFSIYFPWGTKLDKHYKDLAVWLPEHKNHEKFIEILKIAKSKNYGRCNYQPVLKNLME